MAKLILRGLGGIELELDEADQEALAVALEPTITRIQKRAPGQRASLTPGTASLSVDTTEAAAVASASIEAPTAGVGSEAHTPRTKAKTQP